LGGSGEGLGGSGEEQQGAELHGESR
jgi:hypothetical protein